MADSISFEVITPEGLKFQEDVYQVSLPTRDGYIGILPSHIPLITLIVPGIITIDRHRGLDEFEKRERLATAGGFCDVDGKRVRLLADTAERAEDIDEEKAKQALEQAHTMRREAKDALTLEQAVRFISEETARLKVLELKRGWRKSGQQPPHTR